MVLICLKSRRERKETNMDNIIIILIGEKEEWLLNGIERYLEYPEHKKLPSQYIPEIKKEIESNLYIVVRTCAAPIVNYIGSLIGNGGLSHLKCYIYYKNKQHCYDEEGVLIDWEYGCLDNWDT